ncbi:hypothetical protein [Diplocloster agilis]|uniref:Uncharacterized protein n=1 Tax=Diplocloster agilis TaxID=2850323 RepID=A0A949K0I8_9FIRM|nr:MULTISPECIES: hypothetical protein [Lachnospiraceae]MBU9738653.1 hypothetical protein [Diplocloster agilis]MBU9744107.1 hypothetical protein [Diplocloster agilis]MCU6735986.1 hypothetical protein [Suonthocola fibrivorans]SCJ84929.1 Uncharacterised protein [uncultured Clostridium sp.]
MTGGWDYHSELTPYDQFIFYNAIGSHENYFYQPIAVATQIVNGTNYKFMCIAKPRVPGLPAFYAIVEIYKPIDGTPYAVSIYPAEEYRYKK